MIRIFMIFIIPYFAFANTIVDIYRENGIKDVEKHLEDMLQSKEYWKSYLRKRDVSLGYYESVRYLLLANKSKKKLNIYSVSNNSIKLIKSQKIIVGKSGDKIKEGDLRTPIGVYRLVRKFKPQDSFYGPFAYVLSYPNLYDKVHGKSGHGIWIHGSPLDGSPRNPQSKGCVVLENKALKKLDTLISAKKSLILIYENRFKNVSKDEISTILSSLYRWRNAWKYSKLDKYLSFYAEDFRRFDGMRKRYFSVMKKSIFSKKEKKEILFKDINISPYPNIENRKIFRISFYENYKAKKYKFSGNKELYVELQGSKFKILSEK